MAEIDALARKWGDSLAVILPSEIVNEEKIKALDKVHLSIRKETDLKDLFGKLKTEKTPQQLKDESRNGWQ